MEHIGRALEGDDDGPCRNHNVQMRAELQFERIETRREIIVIVDRKVARMRAHGESAQGADKTRELEVRAFRVRATGEQEMPQRGIG